LIYKSTSEQVVQFAPEWWFSFVRNFHINDKANQAKHLTTVVVLVIIAFMTVYFITIDGRDSEIINKKTTTISFDKEEINLGLIEPDCEAKVDFEFENAGAEMLNIYDVVPSCGCTDVDYVKKPIRPGRNGTITVVYNGEDVGYFFKTIKVYANIESRVVNLTIKGTVRENE
jgi:hypothetical protein